MNTLDELLDIVSVVSALWLGLNQLSKINM